MLSFKSFKYLCTKQPIAIILTSLLPYSVSSKIVSIASFFADSINPHVLTTSISALLISFVISIPYFLATPKNNSVSIGKLIGNGASQACKLHVEGKVNAISGFTCDDGVTTITAGHANEINFGGTGTSDTIYFGYRGEDSRPKPTTFVFGSGSGTASVNAGKYFKDGVNIPCVWVQSSQPAAKQTGDIWFIP